MDLMKEFFKGITISEITSLSSGVIISCILTIVPSSAAIAQVDPLQDKLLTVYNTLRGRFEQILKPLARGNAGEVKIEKFEINDNSIDFYVKIHHYQVCTKTACSTGDTYDITKAIQGQIDIFNPYESIQKINFCVDLPPQVGGSACADTQEIQQIPVLITNSLIPIVKTVIPLDVVACARDPITIKPEAINLLEPIDQKLLNCVPKLSSIADAWKSRTDKIQSALSKLEIGNNGSSKECAVPRIVQDCAKWVRTFWGSRECIAPYARQDGCEQWVEKRVPAGVTQDGCNLWIQKRVPSGVTQDGCNQSIEKPISASATCTYDYTFNISTGESKPVFSCGRGGLGEYKIDASAFTTILNGEMPSLGQLLTSVSITSPMFSSNDRDEYQNVRKEIISKYQGSFIYFSSEAFVNWASVENQGANVIASVLTGGSYSAELVRQIEERLRTEVSFGMNTFLSQTAIQLSTEQIVSMMTNNKTIKLNGFNISVKVVNTPKINQKCMIQPRRECLPEIQSPRLGFAIIATPFK